MRGPPYSTHALHCAHTSGRATQAPEPPSALFKLPITRAWLAFNQGKPEGKPGTKSNATTKASDTTKDKPAAEEGEEGKGKDAPPPDLCGWCEGLGAGLRCARCKVARGVILENESFRIQLVQLAKRSGLLGARPQLPIQPPSQPLMAGRMTSGCAAISNEGPQLSRLRECSAGCALGWVGVWSSCGCARRGVE